MYNRRIVCDIDDTISITKDRNFSNAEPILPVIEKINFLYNNGWEIWLVTARGQLSCNGDSQLADIKYRKQIEEWLEKNNVKYHKLSFQKYLATYYIDDKNLTPEEFINLDIKKLKSGWSGADVELRGDGRVYKTHHNSLNASKWYKIASKLFNTPNVYSLIGETICLEYIEPEGEFNVDDVYGIIDKFSKINFNDIDFENYIERIKKHCDYNNNFHDILKFLESNSYLYNKEKSFCHGDLSIENIIINGGKHYLIDPIFEEDSYSSYLLDASKFAMSLRKHGHKEIYNYFYSLFLNPNLVFILEITQWVRVYKYAPENEKVFIEGTIKRLIDEYSSKY